MLLAGAAIVQLFAMQDLSASQAARKPFRHASEFVFPNAAPGESIRVEKILDPSTGRHRLISNSPHVADAHDLVRLEAGEAGLDRRRHGAVSHRLRGKLAAGKGSRNFDVVVHLKVPEGIVYLDKTRHPLAALADQSAALAQGVPRLSLNALAARHGIARSEPLGKSSFRCLVGAAGLRTLRFDPAVAEIEEFREERPIQYRPGALPIANLAASAYSHGTTSPPATAGAGMDAATFETGIDPAVLACFGGLDGSRIDQRVLPWLFWEHSQATFRALQLAAPGARLWHRRSVRYDNPGDDTWIVDRGIRSTSLSYSRRDTDPYDATYREFRVMDDFAYRYPYPTFVNGTANGGYQYIANWHGYNGISVGNVRHTGQAHFELVDTANPRGGCTQTRNPLPRYGSARDREMPQVVAPGWSPTPLSPLGDACLPDTLACGSSFSAPIANGIAAAILAADPRVPSWPEKVRVIMLATARNVDRGEWTHLGDGRDGAGVVHGEGAVRFAREHATVYPGNAAVARGIAAGSLSAGDFASPNPPLVFNIMIPNPKPAGMHLRVVLTWDSNPLLNDPVNSLSDLDLLVTSGSAGRASQSWNGNHEVVDIPAGLFPAGSVVQARVSKFVNRIPAGGRAAFFYYAIGWTWVDDHAP